MGTRNLTIVKLDGKVRVAQYCQWDGYPTGQGATIADFLQNDLDLRKFKAKVAKLTWLSVEEVHGLWKSVGADDSGFVNMEVSNKFSAKYPELHRDTGAKVLSLIQSGKATALHNEISFLKDGLFCEYAYEIDLDKKIVKVIAGRDIFTYTFKQFTASAMEKLEKELKESKD